MGLFKSKDDSSAPPNKLRKPPPRNRISSSPAPSSLPPSTSTTSTASTLPKSTTATGLRSRASSTATHPAAGPRRGILRKPSVSFPTFDDNELDTFNNRRSSAPAMNSKKQYPAERTRFASLPTDHLPSHNEGPYAAVPKSSQPPRPSPLSSGTHIPPRKDSLKGASSESSPRSSISIHRQSQTLDVEVFKAPEIYTEKSGGKSEIVASESHIRPDKSAYSRRPSLVPAGVHPSSIEPFPFVDLKMVMKSLRQALKKEGKRIDDYLEVDDIIEKKCWDTEEVDGLKDCLKKHDRKHAVQQAEKDWRRKERQYHVFGASLKIVSRRAGTAVPVHGFLHQVPFVVAACIERLYDHGMAEPKLLRAKPDPVRLTALICHFDQFEPQAALPNLIRESPIIVAALLSTFITSVQGPIFHRTYFDALWAWAVAPTITRESEYRMALNVHHIEGGDGELLSASDDEDGEDEIILGAHGLPSFNSRKQKKRRAEKERERAKRRQLRAMNPDGARRTRHEARKVKRSRLEHEAYELETPQVAVARFILMCLSPETFSFVVYVFTFLASLPAHPENGVTYDKLSEMYAWKLLGGPVRSSSEATMRWILSRWWRIVEGFKSPEVKTEEEEIFMRQMEEEGILADQSPSQEHPTSLQPGRQPAQPHGRGYPGHINNHPKSSSAKPGRNPFDPNEGAAFLEPDFHDNPDTLPLAPLPSPTLVREVNPLDTTGMKEELMTDTPVIIPFQVEEDEQEECFSKTRKSSGAQSVVSEWSHPQRAAFADIEDLLRPSTIADQDLDGVSVYSQDNMSAGDGSVSVESLIDAYAVSTPERSAESVPVETPVDSDELEKQLRAALEERDKAQWKIEMMQKSLKKSDIR